MKKAWEEAEPGRAAKAMQSRLQYLNSHRIKVCIICSSAVKFCLKCVKLNVQEYSFHPKF